MNRVIRFYDYEQCFAHYTKRIMNIRQAKIYGEVIVAKPVLLLAIIDSIDGKVFIDNRFVINDWIERRYLMLMSKYAKPSQFDDLTGIEKPFWHMETDGFWHLQYPGESLSKGHTPSKGWLIENVSYAYLDDDLWFLLQNKEWRIKLRNYIVEHKLTDGNWFGKIAAEGVGAITALLFAA